MEDSNNPIKYSDLVSPDNSITELIRQLTELQDTYSNALRNIKGEAVQLSATLKNASGATEAGRTATRKAADDADKLAKAQRDLSFAESENAKKLAELKLAQQEANQINKLVAKINQSAEGSYNKLSAQYSLNKIYLNNMTKEERENTEEGKKLVVQTKAIYEEMKRLQEDTGKYQLNVGNYTQASDAIIAYGDRLKETLGLNNAFGESLLALGRGGEEGKAALSAIGEGAKALGNSLLTLLSNPVFLGIAGIAGAGAALKWWYDYNEGLAEATRLTREFTGLAGDELVSVRNDIQALSDVMGHDFKDTLSTVDALMSNYGISAKEAIKVVQDGFTSGADLSGDLLEKLQKYAPTFHDAGISASEMVAILQQTRSGIFSDKGLDIITMASKKIREMSSGTKAALTEIGIDVNKVQEDLADGTRSTFDIIQEVSTKMKSFGADSQQVGDVLKNVFGKNGAEAGIKLIEQLDTMSTDIDELKKQTGEWGEAQEKQIEATKELNGAMSALFDLTDNGFEEMMDQMKLIATKSLVSIVKGVINVTNYFIELYNKSILVRGIWNAIVAGFKTGLDSLGNIFGFFIGIVKATGKALKGAFTFSFDDIKSALAEYATAYGKLIKTQVKDLGKNISKGIADMQKKIKPITIPVSVSNPSANQDTSDFVTSKPTSTSKSSGTKKTRKQKVRRDSSKNNAEDIYKKNLDATRKLQDAMLQLETDSWEKRKKQTEYQYSRRIEDLRHQLATEKNLTAKGREDINATIIVLEQQQTQELLKIEQERQLQELKLQKESIELRLQAAKKGSEEELNLRMQLLDVEKQIALTQNEQKPADQRQDTGAISAGFAEKKSSLSDEYIQAQLQIFDKQQDLAQSEFDLLQNSEARKTQFKLNAEKERWQKILELNKLSSNKLSDVEVETIKNTIAKIDQEIESSKKEEKSKDIYGLFGLNLTEDQKDAINTSMQYALDALNTITEARLEAANAAVEQSNKEVDAAQSALDAELEARANGYASNVVQAQKDLDLAKKNQEKALKEQQKAQKQQQAIQTIQQMGNLITATSLIWSQLGFPWAIPAIATMWGSFAASKIMAANATKQTSGTEQYGEGTVELLEGGSHQSGNDIDLGTKPDGTRRRAEGGEFFAVINKRNSRRFRKIIPDVINSLNNGTFAHKYLNSYSGDMVQLNVSSDRPDIRSLSEDVHEIREQNSRRTHIDGDGNTIENYKNLTRKIKR